MGEDALCKPLTVTYLSLEFNNQCPHRPAAPHRPRLRGMYSTVLVKGDAAFGAAPPARPAAATPWLPAGAATRCHPYSTLAARTPAPSGAVLPPPPPDADPPCLLSPLCRTPHKNADGGDAAGRRTPLEIAPAAGKPGHPALPTDPYHPPFPVCSHRPPPLQTAGPPRATPPCTPALLLWECQLAGARTRPVRPSRLCSTRPYMVFLFRFTRYRNQTLQRAAPQTRSSPFHTPMRLAPSESPHPNPPPSPHWPAVHLCVCWLPQYPEIL